MYLIRKLLLNALYGRFGLAIEQEDHNIVSSRQLDQYISYYNYEVGLPIDLGDNLILVSILNKGKFKNLDNRFFIDNKFNNSIALSAAITGYSRVHMSEFKIRTDFIIYYSDTDSIIINS